MNRYPDEIIILEPTGGDPYNEPIWRQVYTGRCRCFLHRESGYRINKVMDCTHEVVIPDRYMPEIGENFKVGVKMHTNKNNMRWDLVGYVKDFARFDRVCNLYFQMVKENPIYEDIPVNPIDLDKRTNMVYDDEWVHIESVGLINRAYAVEGELQLVHLNKTAWEDEEGTPWAIGIDFLAENPNSGEIYSLGPDHPICRLREMYYKEKIDTHVYLLVLNYMQKRDEETGEVDEDWKPSFTIQLTHPPIPEPEPEPDTEIEGDPEEQETDVEEEQQEEEPVVFYEKTINIVPWKDSDQSEPEPERELEPEEPTNDVSQTECEQPTNDEPITNE